MIYSTAISDIGKYLEELPIGNPWKNIQNINVLIPNLINLVLIAAVVVFFFLILFGGVQWITSGGDKESLSKAKGKITSALVGIIIVFSAWAILNLVNYFFRINYPSSTETCRGPGERCGAGLPACCQDLFCRDGVCKFYWQP